MELWIRSRDKQNIVKAENIYIEKYKPTTHTKIATVQHGQDFVLGYYSIERALEVLDEIQNFIESSGLVVLKDTDVDLKNPYPFRDISDMYPVLYKQSEIQEIKKQKVYQMPEE